jgi:hypothetical protein
MQRIAMRKPGTLISMLLLTGATIAATALISFWPHLSWYFENRIWNSRSVSSIPVAIWQPDDNSAALTAETKLTTLALNGLTLSIPESFQEASLPGEMTKWKLLQCGTLKVLIRQPNLNATTRDAFLSNSLPAKRKDPHSYVRTSADIYEVSSDDFKWSMSYDELRYFDWLVRVAEHVRSWQTTSAAIFIGHNVDGLVHFADQSASIEWYACNGEHFGNVVIEGEECNGVSKEELARIIGSSLSWTSPCESPSQMSN